MSKVDPLIRTKLRLPFIRPDLVPRPRLQARVVEGLHFPLTLVIAPAGFGKTTLVASSLTGCCLPAAWLSLDQADNQLGRFLSYLVAVVQETIPSMGEEAGQLTAGAQPAPPEAVLTTLVNGLDASGREMVLVLDDYQFITSQAVHAAVEFLLEHSPSNFHLLIATRSDPPLPLSRLRARGQMVELRAEDLSFTRAEASQFLTELMGLTLTVEQIAALEERTEGWVAGLQMAALSMRGNRDVDGFIRAFAGTNRFIMEFMLEEVLAREPEEVQSFLLQTSILTRLNGLLCDAVSGISGGQEMLESLEKRALFLIPLDDSRQWYRYHHLFADLLQARLRSMGCWPITSLHRRAATWCDQQGYPSEAVGYALAAHDDTLASSLVEKYWTRFVNNGEVEVVWLWLEALPAEVVKRRAPLAMAYCWVLWLMGQVDQIEKNLPDAERAVEEFTRQPEAAEDPVLSGLLPVMVAIMRSIVAREHQDFDQAVSLGEGALRLIPLDFPAADSGILRTLIFLALASAYDGAGDLEKSVQAYREAVKGSRLADNPGGLAGMTYRMAVILLRLGRLREAEQACYEALDYLRANGSDRLPVAGLLHVAVSEILVERDELEDAQSHLAEGFKLAKWSGRYDAVRNAPRPLSRLKMAQGDAAGALTAVQDAEIAQGNLISAQLKASLLSLRARVLQWQGDLAQAKLCADQAVEIAGKDRGQAYQFAWLASIRAHLALDGPADVVDSLSAALSLAEAGDQKGQAVEVLLLRSMALARLGKLDLAEADVGHALELAAPEGYLRIFLEEGPALQRILACWLAHAGPGPLREYAVGLLARFGTQSEPPAIQPEKNSATGGLIEPLSGRELEVLHLLALGTTNRNIAEQLFISPGTVKAHTANIYRKLDAANRTEAVAHARQLGLLPDF